MLFRSRPTSLQPIVTYLKSSESRQFDRDLEILNKSVLQFNKPFSLVIDQEDESKKFDEVICAAIRGNVQMVMIPSLSHLGFQMNDSSSAIGDILDFAKTKVNLISVRDGFDSNKDGYRTAVNIICRNMKSQQVTV